MRYFSKIFHRGCMDFKWSHTISFPSYCQIHIVQAITWTITDHLSEMLPCLGSKSQYSHARETPLFSTDFVNEPYLVSSLATYHSCCENRFHMLFISYFWKKISCLWIEPRILFFCLCFCLFVCLFVLFCFVLFCFCFLFWFVFVFYLHFLKPTVHQEKNNKLGIFHD